MFWLNKCFSLEMLKKLFEHSPFHIVKDQYGRCVICGSEKENNLSTIQKILDTNHINAILIPCNEECKLYVRSKLHNVF